MRTRATCKLTRCCVGLALALSLAAGCGISTSPGPRLKSDTAERRSAATEFVNTKSVVDSRAS